VQITAEFCGKERKSKKELQKKHFCDKILETKPIVGGLKK